MVKISQRINLYYCAFRMKNVQYLIDIITPSYSKHLIHVNFCFNLLFFISHLISTVYYLKFIVDYINFHYHPINSLYYSISMNFVITHYNHCQSHNYPKFTLFCTLLYLHSLLCINLRQQLVYALQFQLTILFFLVMFIFLYVFYWEFIVKFRLQYWIANCLRMIYF